MSEHPVAAEDRLVLPGASSPMGAALSVALDACDEADAIALASFREAHELEAKADRSFVTAADREVERVLRARLSARFPEDGLVGEEYGEQPTGNGRRWFIDPIDGTHNYMRGVPIFATLLGLEVEGRPDLGVVSAPALGRRWFAWRGGGAWAVDTRQGTWLAASALRLRVSAVSALEDAQVLYSSVPGILRSGLAPGFIELLGRSWRDRGLGDFWGYMLVAEGAAEAMLEAELSPWDLAAPRAVVEEAGGRVTDVRGGLDLPGRGVLATNGLLHEAVLAVLGSSAAGDA